jgi:UDP-2,3-diacylglucosamine hydrolase
MHQSNMSQNSAPKAQPQAIALFVSDLHLQAALPHTTQAFFDFLQHHAMKSRQLYLLGDMFEYWAGDDDIATPYNRQVVDAIRQVSDSGVQVFWMADWQEQFLALPLTQRKAIIDTMRNESRAAQSAKSYEIMDVNANAIAALFDRSGTALMIHGHTHRPARHEYGDGDANRVRYVLPDWDCEGESARGGWIALDSNGAIQRYDVAGTEQR